MFEVKRKRWRILGLFEANVWLNTSREDSVGMVIKKRSCYFLSTFVSVWFSRCAAHIHTHAYTMGTLSHTPQRSHHRIWHKRTTQRRPELPAHTQQKPNSSACAAHWWVSEAEEQVAVLKVSAGSGGPSLSWCAVYRRNLYNLPPAQRLRRLWKRCDASSLIFNVQAANQQSRHSQTHDWSAVLPRWPGVSRSHYSLLGPQCLYKP